MKSFKRYLIPSVIASIFMSAYAIVDGIFIGQKIGDVGLSAINIAWPITAFLQAIGLALGLSGGIIITKLHAREMDELAGRVKLTTILLVIVTSIVLGLILYFSSEGIIWLFGARDEALDLGVRYIRIILIGSLFQMLGTSLIPLLKNSGKVRWAFAASIASILVNLILDYLFIYKFNWGLEGAAIASVLAQGASAIVALATYISEFRGITLDKIVIKDLFLGSLAPFILNYSYSFIIIIVNALCLNYGGDAAVAAYTLLSYLLYIVSATATGVSDAIQPLFSYHYAKNEYEYSRKLLYRCLVISLSIIVVFDILFILLRDKLAVLYNLSDIAGEYYKNGLIYYLIGFIFVSIIKVISSYLYSIDKKIEANIMTLFEPFVLTPIIYSICCLILKINGVWVGYLAIQVLMLGLGCILFFRIKGKEI